MVLNLLLYLLPLAGHQQLLIVTTQDWEAIQGELILYERDGDDSLWRAASAPIPVVVGEKGLAMSDKKEGDGKSPAGIFALGSAFGFASSAEMAHLKVDYLPLHEYIEAVDDPLSCHYNSIVDRRQLVPDWQSSEKMAQEPLYALGIVVHHNFPHPKAYAGSCIFLHIWQDGESGTRGCTAMSREHIALLLSWLDCSKAPALVQLPIRDYQALQEAWGLPLYSLHDRCFLYPTVNKPLANCSNASFADGLCSCRGSSIAVIKSRRNCGV